MIDFNVIVNVNTMRTKPFQRVLALIIATIFCHIDGSVFFAFAFAFCI